MDKNTLQKMHFSQIVINLHTYQFKFNKIFQWNKVDLIEIYKLINIRKG